jgi:MEMO1 family protein
VGEREERCKQTNETETSQTLNYLMKVRKAKRAGTWYTDNVEILNRDLDRWLDKAKTELLTREPEWSDHCAHLNTIIVPHAGYMYSGSTAGYAYACMLEATRRREIKRVFLLGPSHYTSLKGCALSCCDQIRTPLGDLKVDTALIGNLLITHSNLFHSLEVEVEEQEHSMEMQFPYLKKILSHTSTLIVPIMIGRVSDKELTAYSSILAEYMFDSNALCIASSDFCHWGPQFDYMPFDEKLYRFVYEHIEEMDRQGIRLIEELNSVAFSKYLKETGNTICGRYPILVMLKTMELIRQQKAPKFDIRLLKYRQSSRIQISSSKSPHSNEELIEKKKPTDDASSVSYVALSISIF